MHLSGSLCGAKSKCSRNCIAEGRHTQTIIKHDSRAVRARFYFFHSEGMSTRNKELSEIVLKLLICSRRSWIVGCDEEEMSENKWFQELEAVVVVTDKMAGTTLALSLVSVFVGLVTVLDYHPWVIQYQVTSGIEQFSREGEDVEDFFLPR